MSFDEAPQPSVEDEPTPECTSPPFAGLGHVSSVAAAISVAGRRRRAIGGAAEARPASARAGITGIMRQAAPVDESGLFAKRPRTAPFRRLCHETSGEHPR